MNCVHSLVASMLTSLFASIDVYLGNYSRSQASGSMNNCISARQLKTGSQPYYKLSPRS